MQQLQCDIVHYHLMKTAGTTVNKQLALVYGDDAMAPFPYLRSDGSFLDPATQQVFEALTARQGFAVFHGHPHEQPKNWQRVLARKTPRYSITVFREPFRRFISLCYFMIRSKYVRQHLGDYIQNPKDALACTAPPFTDNIMTLTLAYAGEDIDWNRPANTKDLALAAKKIAALDLVGLTEEFPLTYAMLAHDLDFQPPPLTRWNVHKGYPAAEEQSQEIISAFVKKNVLDCELYQLAKEHFYAKLASSPQKLQETVKTLAESGEEYITKVQK